MNAGYEMANKGDPPNYEQDISPDFIPIGDEKDLEKARRIAGSLKVYAALRPTEDTIQKVVRIEYGIPSLIYCLIFPCGCACIPCVIPCLMDRAESLRNTLYVVTEDSILVSVDDYTPPCACSCTTGRDSSELTFDNIVDVKVDNRGRGCGCCRPPYVTLCFVNRRVVHLYVENTEGVAHLIRQLRRARKEGPSKANAIVQQPVAVTQPPNEAAVNQKKKRIFVARNDNPTSFSVVNLKGDTEADWEQFLDDVRRTLNVYPTAKLTVTLAEVNATITAADQLDNNDKVVIASTS